LRVQTPVLNPLKMETVYTGGKKELKEGFPKNPFAPLFWEIFNPIWKKFNLPPPIPHRR